MHFCIRIECISQIHRTFFRVFLLLFPKLLLLVTCSYETASPYGHYQVIALMSPFASALPTFYAKKVTPRY